MEYAEEIIKICNKCFHAYTLDFYYKNTGWFGKSARCINCDRKRHAIYYKSDKRKKSLTEWAYKQQLDAEIEAEKLCGKCKRILPLDNFYRKTYGRLGREDSCKKCKDKSNRAFLETEAGKRMVRKYTQSEKGKLNRKRFRHSEKGKAYERSRRKTDSYQVGRSSRQVRYRIRSGVVTTLTGKEWAVIKKHYNYKCVYCGRKEKLTIDHIIPLSKGGQHTKENVVPACRSCNAIKGNRPTLLQLLPMSSS